MDPPRPEAIDAVQRCQLAGIVVKMITGDHALTAKAIAAQLGLTNHELAPISGRHLDSGVLSAADASAGREAFRQRGDVDIVFRVEERRTGNINFGASLGQGTGVGGFWVWRSRTFSAGGSGASFSGSSARTSTTSL